MANNITIDIDTPIIYRGADISKHNGDINWDKVDNKELNFVIIRAGYGFSTVDVQFYRNIEGAIKAGVDVGIYWFSYAHTAEDAKLEAQACLRIIEPYKEHITFPVWFDWEYDSDNYVRNHYGIVLDKARVSAIAKSFMQTVEAAGYKTGNYSNPDYLKRYFNDDIKNNYDVWLAHVKDSKGNPRLRSDYQGAYTMHQYSWVGQPK
jgi:GH25 family lysozyme M1 (1,4-beta-N-acetylmuramidase)